MDAQGVTSEIVAAAFGAVVREFRKERGLSQERLAELSHLHHTYVSLLERGKRQPSLSTIIQLAHALGVSTPELVAKAENRIRS